MLLFNWIQKQCDRHVCDAYCVAPSFHSDISLWETSNNVTDLHRMFFNATLFNREFFSWDTSSEISMDDICLKMTHRVPSKSVLMACIKCTRAAIHVYNGATSFNQRISHRLMGHPCVKVHGDTSNVFREALGCCFG
jgi:hypothetical protein